jgi:hypothetical protein
MAQESGKHLCPVDSVRPLAAIASSNSSIPIENPSQGACMLPSPVVRCKAEPGTDYVADEPHDRRLAATEHGITSRAARSAVDVLAVALGIESTPHGCTWSNGLPLMQPHQNIDNVDAQK